MVTFGDGEGWGGWLRLPDVEREPRAEPCSRLPRRTTDREVGPGERQGDEGQGNTQGSRADPPAAIGGTAVRIVSVVANGRRRAFEIGVPGGAHSFPYAKCNPRPSAADPVVEVFVDPELADEAFTYRLRAGGEGSVHIDWVLDYNRDPVYLRDMLLYELTLAAQKHLAETLLSKREIIRRMG